MESVITIKKSTYKVDASNYNNLGSLRKVNKVDGT